MPRSRASVELVASPAEVWRFVSEPYHLPDWWPNLVAVEPDRRGFAVGARWRVRTAQATLFRRASAEDTLLVAAVEPERLFGFELVEARLRAELALAPAEGGRTRAELDVAGPLLLGFSRSLPKEALARLHDLCQTAASL
jgi:uncharacterized protein YndB with AHSA1/START domain